MPRFMKSLNNISRSQSVFRSAYIKADDLWFSHQAFLLTLNRFPGCSQERIAEELCLNKSTVTRGLASLEERGYVKREINAENKREIKVFLTDKAMEILPLIKASSREWSERVTHGIAQEELDVFYSVLFRIESRAKEIVEGMEEK